MVSQEQCGGCILTALVRLRLPHECGPVDWGGGAYGMFEGYKGTIRGQVTGLLLVSASGHDSGHRRR